MRTLNNVIYGIYHVMLYDYAELTIVGCVFRDLLGIRQG